MTTFNLHKRIGLLFILVTVMLSVAAQEKKTQEIFNGKQVINAPVVVKNFVQKNGEEMDFGEYYVRQSVQDYYIKFCESSITRKDLERQLAAIDSEIKTLTLEVEFREGNWDICEGDGPQQSRVGEYVIIYRIVGNR